jgi:tRNA/rRNA methyltransferase
MVTRFILIEPSHAGNVGAVARAMKTMGFTELMLVAPRWPNVLRRKETIERASGAVDVLASARIVATLDEALHGLTHLCATAMTPRDFGPPTRTPREHFAMLLNSERLPQAASALAADSAFVREPPSGLGLLFGSERYGMKNDDVYRCHVCLNIPSNPQFGSLNLAAAVQLVAYELRLAMGGFDPVPAAPHPQLADAAEIAGALHHWQRALVHLGFLDPAAPKKLMPRLQQLLNRAELRPEEVHILRGIAKAVEQTTPAQQPRTSG